MIDDGGELITETKLSSEVTDIIAYLDALALQIAGVQVIGSDSDPGCLYMQVSGNIALMLPLINDRTDGVDPYA